MLRTIVWYSHFALSLVLKTPEMFIVKSMIKNGKDKKAIDYLHRTTKRWAKSQVRLSGAKVKMFGEENIPKDIPVLFISNHQSNFDIALFLSYIDKPKGYIAKAEMKKWPLVHTWMEYIDCVFMDRSNIRKSAEAIVEGVNILKNGHSLVIFPEGTRSKGDNIGDFKGGSFKLATKAKVPIVPVTINGSFKLMEQNGNKIKPAEVEIHIHPMIETSNLSKEELDKLPTRVKEIVVSKLPK